MAYNQSHDSLRIGVVWWAPWRIEISDAVKSEGNALEIEVPTAGRTASSVTSRNLIRVSVP